MLLLGGDFRPQLRSDGDFSRSEWYKAAMSLLQGGAEGPEEPCGIGRFYRAAGGRLFAVAVW